MIFLFGYYSSANTRSKEADQIFHSWKKTWKFFLYLQNCLLRIWKLYLHKNGHYISRSIYSLIFSRTKVLPSTSAGWEYQLLPLWVLAQRMWTTPCEQQTYQKQQSIRTASASAFWLQLYVLQSSGIQSYQSNCSTVNSQQEERPEIMPLEEAREHASLVQSIYLDKFSVS